MHIVVISCFLFVCGIVDANPNKPLDLINEFPTLNQVIKFVIVYNNYYL